MHATLPHVDFIVMYGQTEASARISYLPAEYLETKKGSVGIGIEGVTVTVRNPRGQECAAREKGEICVQGNNVMRGYWNNLEATAAVFCPKLFTAVGLFQ